MGVRGVVVDSLGNEIAEVIDTGTLDAGEGVEQTGDEVIDGVKTFIKSPVIPSATAAAHPPTKAQLDDALAGRVPVGRQVTVGYGLAGGGDLSADRSFAVSLGADLATATADTAVSNSSYTLLSGMTLTPAAGAYLVWFTSSVESSSVTDLTFLSIFVGGSQVAASEIETDSKTANEADAVQCVARVVVDGTQAIEVKWKNNGAATATAHERTLIALRLS